MTAAYQPKPFEIAGVDLFGRRQADGTVKIGTDPDETSMPDFPTKIEVCGVVYVLEVVRKNRDECDITDPAHPGYNIEWGVYV